MESIIRGRTSYSEDDPVYGRLYVASWTAIASSQSEALALLESAEGVRRGVSYRDEQGNIPDPYIICQRLPVRARSVAPVGGKGLYEITGYFHYPRARIAPLPQPGQPARIWVESQLESEEVEADILGNPLRNSAGDQFTGITRLRVARTLKLEWTVVAPNFAYVYGQFQQFEGKVNNDKFLGAEAGSLLCAPFEIEEMVWASQSFQDSTFRILATMHYHPRWRAADGQYYDGWTTVVANLGWHFLNEEGKRTHILLPDEQGNLQPARAPQYLSADGRQHGDTITVKKFELYERVAFSSINIPLGGGGGG
jgi:hypothetical protein